MGKKKRSTTEWMLEAVQTEQTRETSNFPPTFLAGLRGALEVGLSGEEITAFLVLFTGVYETSENMLGQGLIDRAKLLVDVMREDIDQLDLDRIRVKRNKERNRVKKQFSKWNRGRG